MIKSIKRPISDGLILLTTTNDSAESEIVSRMLDSNGIDVYIYTEGTSNVAGLVVAPIPQYSIYVSTNCLSDAENLLITSEHDDDKDWHEYRQQLRGKGAYWVRIIGIILALFLLILAFSPMKESDNSMRYFLVALSFVLQSIVLFSFYKE